MFRGRAGLVLNQTLTGQCNLESKEGQFMGIFRDVIRLTPSLCES